MRHICKDERRCCAASQRAPKTEKSGTYWIRRCLASELESPNALLQPFQVHLCGRSPVLVVKVSPRISRERKEGENALDSSMNGQRTALNEPFAATFLLADVRAVQTKGQLLFMRTRGARRKKSRERERGRDAPVICVNPRVSNQIGTPRESFLTAFLFADELLDRSLVVAVNEFEDVHGRRERCWWRERETEKIGEEVRSRHCPKAVKRTKGRRALSKVPEEGQRHFASSIASSTVEMEDREMKRGSKKDVR